MVNEHSLVVGLISDEAAPQEIAVLRRCAGAARRSWRLSEADYGLGRMGARRRHRLRAASLGRAP